MSATSTAAAAAAAVAADQSLSALHERLRPPVSRCPLCRQPLRALACCTALEGKVFGSQLHSCTAARGWSDAPMHFSVILAPSTSASASASTSASTSALRACDAQPHSDGVRCPDCSPRLQLLLLRFPQLSWPSVFHRERIASESRCIPNITDQTCHLERECVAVADICLRRDCEGALWMLRAERSLHVAPAALTSDLVATVGLRHD